MDGVEEAPVPVPVPAPVEAAEAALVVLPAVLPVALVGEGPPAVVVRARPATEAARPAEALGFPHPSAAAGMITILLTAQPMAPLGVAVVVDLGGPGCGIQGPAVPPARSPLKERPLKLRHSATTDIMQAAPEVPIRPVPDQHRASRPSFCQPPRWHFSLACGS